LRAVVDEVAKREGGAPAAVCISHPANWGPYKTDLLLQAVRLSGLDEPVRFTTEPEAAAVFYAQQQRLEPGAIVAVYDLGGGTFDAAVLRKTAVGFDIMGRPEGIERLGGIDFDAAVFSHVARALGGKLEELDENDPTAIAAVARLREECVSAKEALSADTDVSIPVLLPNISTEIRLTRAELEAMVRPALHDSIEALRRALRSANVAPEQLHSVLLVGGSSRMPIVAQLVGAELGRPVAVDAHPKHAVALGAAWLASGALSATPAERAVATAPTMVPPRTPTSATLLPTSATLPPTPAGAAAVPSSPVAGAPVGGAPVGSAAVGAASVGSAMGSASVGSAGVTPRQAVQRPGAVYGGTPPGQRPPTGTSGAGGFTIGGKRMPLLVAAAAVIVLMIGGGVALALMNREDPIDPNGQGTGDPTVTASASTEAPQVPADEQCTDAIKSNPQWVCLTSAVMTSQNLTISYEAGGTPFNINGGYHLHIYAANADGSDPADNRMGVHSPNPGNWYVEDRNPSVKQYNGSTYQEIPADAVKVCARIAQGGHALVQDNSGNGTYTTGNCIPVTRQ
jgi:actin-like ATPase involved in cell morphogenesis